MRALELSEREHFQRMNDLLEAEDAAMCGIFDRCEYPPCFIIGPPRVGSTLLQQILISTTSIGYISNLLGIFWKAPFFGCVIEKKFRPVEFRSTFQSAYGNTSGAFEPQEWGWFWQKWLRLEGDNHYLQSAAPPDWKGLSQRIAAITAIKGQPVLFDSVFVTANIDAIYANLQPALIINLQRDPFFLANSIANARVHRYGDIQRFYGHKPRDWAKLSRIPDPIEQIVLQVKMIRDEVNKSISIMDSAAVLTVSYEDLIRQPRLVVEQMVSWFAGRGLTLEVRADALDTLPIFENRNTDKLVDPALKAHLVSFLKKYELI